MAHTKQPWLANLVNLTVGTGPNRPLICLADPRLPADEVDANLHLIAAAPALLAALEDVRDTIWADCRIPADMRKDWEAVYHNVIMAAIRAAKGQA
jgi:hypothetical protein